MGKLRMCTNVWLQTQDLELNLDEFKLEDANYKFHIGNMIICKRTWIRKLVNTIENWSTWLFTEKKFKAPMKFILKTIAPAIPAGMAAIIPLVFEGEGWKICMDNRMRMVVPFENGWSEENKKAFSASLRNRFIMDRNDYALDHIIFYE